MSSATAQQARERAREAREERVEEVAQSLLQGEEPTVDDPEILEDAADRVEEIEEKERVEELQDRGRAIVEDQVEAMQRSTAAAGGLDQEIRRLREKLVEKLAARRERVETYRDAKGLAEALAEALQLGTVPRIEPPGEAPDLDVEAEAEEAAESSSFDSASAERVARNLSMADDGEDAESAARQLRTRLETADTDGDPCEVVEEYAELVLIPRKEQAAEQRRRTRLKRRAVTFGQSILRGRPTAGIELERQGFPDPVEDLLRELRDNRDERRQFTGGTRDLREEIEEAFEEAG